jgi:N-acetylglucosaminyl-diphospho-decaprenol L-rhamnosyltransferase
VAAVQVTRSDGELDVGEDWSLITVTFNSAEQLRSTWAAAEYGNAHWIVVDNASMDGSAAVAEELGAEVVELRRNIGFGAANNVALSMVETPWTLFVNPDVEVGSPHDLTRLAEVGKATRALVAPQLMNRDGTDQPNARGLPFLVDKFANRSVQLPGARLTDYVRTGLEEPTFVAWVIGAAVGGATEAFRHLGGWDERFFIYYEDHDLGLRAWEAGMSLVVDPHVRWVHEWQRATMRPHFLPWKHEFISMRRFYKKYPELLARRRMGRRDGRFGELTNRLWNEIGDD